MVSWVGGTVVAGVTGFPAPPEEEEGEVEEEPGWAGTPVPLVEEWDVRPGRALATAAESRPPATTAAAAR